jgi:predicted HAD superfamily Cof-like phosphohydrolase
MITQQNIDDLNNLFDTPLEMVREFTYAMGQPLDEKHGFSRKLEDMRWALIKEEFAEVRDAVGYSEILKELADLVYVTYGYAATYGWDLDEAVRRVHISNMSKLGVDGKPLKRPDGKVLKGPNYKKPVLSDLV